MEKIKQNNSILIVEDDNELRELMLEALQTYGFRCQGTACWEQAQKLARSQQYQFYIIDIVLGEKSGLDLIPVITEKEGDGKIIIASGNTHSDIERRNPNVWKNYQKPFNLCRLAEEMIEWLDFKNKKDIVIEQARSHCII